MSTVRRKSVVPNVPSLSYEHASMPEDIRRSHSCNEAECPLMASFRQTKDLLVAIERLAADIEAAALSGDPDATNAGTLLGSAMAIRGLASRGYCELVPPISPAKA